MEADFNEDSSNATLANIGDDLIDLTGWTLCSLEADRAFTIANTIESGEVITFFFDDSEGIEDIEPDDAVLYDPNGTLISYFVEP